MKAAETFKCQNHHWIRDRTLWQPGGAADHWHCCLHEQGWCGRLEGTNEEGEGDGMLQYLVEILQPVVVGLELSLEGLVLLQLGGDVDKVAVRLVRRRLVLLLHPVRQLQGKGKVRGHKGQRSQRSEVTKVRGQKD